MLNETKTLTISIDAAYDTVMADLADPMTHPEWATEFFSGKAEPGTGGSVIADVPMMGGRIQFKIESHADQGILDLFLAPVGAEYGNPLPVRILRNGDGVDILWTLTRFPGMPDQVWQDGLQSMDRELLTLKARYEAP